jgi:DNA replication and repair protein RecF
MVLQRLVLENFRNHPHQVFDLHSKIIITGDNGTGKSSLLEAIRILSVGKSFRTARFDEITRFEQPFFRIQGLREEEEKKEIIDFFYGIQFAQNPLKERRLTVNEKEVSWLDFLGRFPTVVFTPMDIEVISGSPGVRRRYVDGIVWQIDPEFRQAYLELNRILRERSTVLFLIKKHRASLEELRPWNELLDRATEVVRMGRQKFIEYASNNLKHQQDAFGEGLDFDVVYQFDARSFEELEKQEIQLAQNLYGPHRDEIEVLFNTRSARKYASRGQSRTAAALLKVVEASYLTDSLGVAPLILLDDILSELDDINMRSLLRVFGDNNQMIVTGIHSHALFKDYTQIKLS